MPSWEPRRPERIEPTEKKARLRATWRFILPKTIPTDKARQGRRGWQVLLVLICALLLAAVVWFAVEFYGKAIEPGAGQPTTGQIDQSETLG
jgi:hypothetical protein